MPIDPSFNEPYTKFGPMDKSPRCPDNLGDDDYSNRVRAFFDVFQDGDEWYWWEVYINPLAASGGLWIVRDGKPIARYMEWIS